jgi:hypothetical protein
LTDAWRSAIDEKRETAAIFGETMSVINMVGTAVVVVGIALMSK